MNGAPPEPAPPDPEPPRDAPPERPFYRRAVGALARSGLGGLFSGSGLLCAMDMIAVLEDSFLPRPAELAIAWLLISLGLSVGYLVLAVSEALVLYVSPPLGPGRLSRPFVALAIFAALGIFLPLCVICAGLWLFGLGEGGIRRAFYYLSEITQVLRYMDLQVFVVWCALGVVPLSVFGMVRAWHASLPDKPLAQRLTREVVAGAGAGLAAGLLVGVAQHLNRYGIHQPDRSAAILFLVFVPCTVGPIGLALGELLENWICGRWEAFLDREDF